MAVHDDYPGLTVEICVDSKPLEEYQTEEEERQPKTTTRYIECRSGMEFKIKTNFTPPFAPMDTVVKVYPNGSIVGGKIAHSHEMLEKTYTHSKTCWREGEEWRACSFLFSDLTLVVKGDVPSHTIRFGPEKATKPRIMAEVKRAAGPLATFQFKYRSIAVLKALGIVPGSPSPSPIARPELSEKGGTPETTPNIILKGVSPAAVDTPRPKTTSVTPAPPHQNSVRPTSDDDKDLTDEDIIALIKHYRGNDKGLASQSRKRLMVLLKHYEEKDTERVLVNQETVANEPRVCTKHELTGDTIVRQRGKKRKTGVIVLDD